MPWLLIVLLAGHSYPSYFKEDQQINAAVIIEQANRFDLDPYRFVAIAWVESRLKPNRISHTGDYGIFQVNYKFWGKKWEYKSKKKFLIDMSSPGHATVAAAVVLKEMRKYKACAGLNLAACYNGGPGWQKSKNIKKILEYADRVNCLARSYRRKFPNWKQ